MILNHDAAFSTQVTRCLTDRQAVP